ncbi:sensor histidine kinase [Allomuricauda sp. SCSIO 65647]|uniref:sensor histidine kinase n=1 Tax=Allomuricauda sp. SCSIO 65647 TaxID=2908843 RepID=UPI001F1B3F5D|nr:histidine kinase [Muricauda sp. SCSIO 65647]UJH67807.1 histidine kinase [Muricauda sp. SCSIO 65647]
MILKLNRTRVAIYLIWVVAALFTSTQLYLKTLDANGTDSWGKLFFIQFLVWNIWGALSPLIFWLGKRFRIDRQTYYRGLLIHLVFAVVIVIAYLALYSIIWNFLGIGSFSRQTFTTYFKVFFLNLFHWHFFIYMAIIGLAHAIQYQKELKQRQEESIELERQLLISELNTLKAQLSPHFLFNTINNVVSTIEQGKNDVASGMLIRLGEFLRICLEESKHKLIPLRKELDHIRKYLEIEQFRNDDLQVIIRSEKEHESVMVPSFILQPIVENAIKHGISKSNIANRIEIGSELKQGFLKLFVYNEGPGLANEMNRNKGIGVDNTVTRLKKLYGKRGHLELFSVNDGVMVEIRIPLQ